MHADITQARRDDCNDAPCQRGHVHLVGNAVGAAHNTGCLRRVTVELIPWHHCLDLWMQVKKKMTCDEFVRNNRGINGGEDLPRPFLASLYSSIRRNEIRISSDAQARS